MSSYELRFRIIYLVMWILLCPMSMSLFLEELKEFQSRGSTERNTGLQSSVRYEPNGDVFEFTVNGIPDHDTGICSSFKFKFIKSTGAYCVCLPCLYLTFFQDIFRQ